MSAGAGSVKYRYYESETRVAVEVPIKNVVQEDLSVSFGPESLSVNVKLPENQSYSLNLTLFGTILPDQSTYKIRPSKIEISMVKQVQVRWGTLEKELPPSTASSKTNPKNWDKVVKENLDEKDESINELFSKIYADGDDDQKRAMMKSFSESGGTVLSTNWKQVGKKKVEVKPPEGCEYKQWTN